jgi:hypothetical protein
MNYHGRKEKMRLDFIALITAAFLADRCKNAAGSPHAFPYIHFRFIRIFYLKIQRIRSTIKTEQVAPCSSEAALG